jgi:hypothetical protein
MREGGHVFENITTMDALNAAREAKGKAIAAYSDAADHRFRQADRGFRFMPITLEERRSIAGRGVVVEG